MKTFVVKLSNGSFLPVEAKDRYHAWNLALSVCMLANIVANTNKISIASVAPPKFASIY